MHKIDSDQHVDGRFVSEDALHGQGATQITAEWLNAVQEELIHAIALGAQPLDKNHNDQLKTTIANLFAQLRGGVPKHYGTLHALYDLIVGHYIPNAKKSSSIDSANGDTVATSAAVQQLHALAQRMTPIGLISMWSGNRVPVHWHLCDGSTVTAGDGVKRMLPDLRSRFIFGAQEMNKVGSSGGATNKNTSNAGAHGHGGGVGYTTLNHNQMPKHRHASIDYKDHRYSVNGASTGPNIPGWHVDGKNIRSRKNMTSYEGNSYSHNHSLSISSGGSHSHSVDVTPPYYTLAFIYYLGA